jgi:hypothetical protein
MKIETKEWTIMLYFASDNPLAPGIVSQLKAIKDAGFHHDANVIAQFDPHGRNAQAHIFDVNYVNKLRSPNKSRVGAVSNDPYVRNLVLDKLWGKKDQDIKDRIKKSLKEKKHWHVLSIKDDLHLIAEDDSLTGADDVRPTDDDYDSPAIIEYDPPTPSNEMLNEQDPKKSLSSFLQFCKKNYPARHYILFILGHGVVVGNDLFLFDENAPQEHSLLLKDLGDVLRAFRKDIGKDSELELVGFHSCSMSGLEVAYELECGEDEPQATDEKLRSADEQLQGTANYMLASQGSAFVGSWPYKNILIRIFNDLNSSQLTVDELRDVAGLAAKLKAGGDARLDYLRSRFEAKTIELLGRFGESPSSDKKFCKALIKELNKAISDPALFRVEQFKDVKSKATKRLKSVKLTEQEVMRLNCVFLADACPEDIVRVNVKKMFKRIFYYCLYNSYDFQLAGYSFDLTLCDLKKVPDIKEPLIALSKALREALKKGAHPLAQERILLAHWDAQSYWKENYTDLYDFCFRLKRRCLSVNPALEEKPEGTDATALRDIYDACEGIMDKLQRGVQGEDDGIIVRSEFAGPTYQYSHGLSVFFPWSKPADSFFEEQYTKYKFCRDTFWAEFLDKYFTQTQRHTHREEINEGLDPKEKPTTVSSMEEDLLDRITVRIFNESGQLAKGGGNDAMAKGGGNDPTGEDCNCPSIKNYPSVTNVPEKEKTAQANQSITSQNFYEGLRAE